MPTVLIIDGNRVVQFVATSPDWLARIEAPEVLGAVQTALKAQHQKDFA